MPIGRRRGGAPPPPPPTTSSTSSPTRADDDASPSRTPGGSSWNFSASSTSSREYLDVAAYLSMHLCALYRMHARASVEWRRREDPPSQSSSAFALFAAAATAAASDDDEKNCRSNRRSSLLRGQVTLLVGSIRILPKNESFTYDLVRLVSVFTQNCLCTLSTNHKPTNIVTDSLISELTPPHPHRQT